MDAFLDQVFFWAHLVVIVTNLTGWILPTTRLAHLILVNVTAASWVALGWYWGWGYCFLTDWHWEVKARLGEKGLPDSFITYLLKRLGLRVEDTLVVPATGGLF